MKLSDVLKILIERKGVSLREIEEATGVSNAYLSQLQRGEAENPSVDKLQKLAAYFRVPLWLLVPDERDEVMRRLDEIEARLQKVEAMAHQQGVLATDEELRRREHDRGCGIPRPDLDRPVEPMKPFNSAIVDDRACSHDRKYC